MGFAQWQSGCSGDSLQCQRVGINLLLSCRIVAKGSGKWCMRIMSISRGARNKKTLFSASLVGFVCGLIFSCGGLAYADTVYVDSQQHFTIQVPPGWVAKPYKAGGASGVTIVHGADAYVQIFLQKGIDPATFLQALNTEIQNTHTGYRVSD